MLYGSVCSGIEGASCAFSPLGWKAAWFSEINPYCCALLEKHYPEVPNLGDANKIKPTPVDLIVAGTPCQSFSVMGERKGLDDERGQLAMGLGRILRSTNARWLIWENVPGVLSSNQGRDFGAFLRSLGELGFHCAWRVLDSRYFGVPQRRSRVYVVGRFGDWRPAAAVLFDSPSCPETSGEATKVQEESSSRSLAAVGGPWFGVSGDETPKSELGISPTLRASQGGEGNIALSRTTFRRFTTLERERLQGFPDGYTQVDGYSEKQRWSALGNAFCVPVLHWLGRRVHMVESSGQGS